MLTDEERFSIWDKLLRETDRVDITNRYAIEIERAVLAKAMPKQEPLFIGNWDNDLRFSPISFVDGVFRSSIPNGTAIYAHSVPAQAAAIPDGWQLVPIEPTHDQCMKAAFNLGRHHNIEFVAENEEFAMNVYREMLSASPKPDKS